MGRKILVGENPSLHPIISLSLFIASMVAIFALVSSLCIMRKKSPHLSSSQRKSIDNANAVSQPPNEVAMRTTPEMITEPPSTTTVELDGAKDVAQPKNEEPPLPLPPPPGMPHLRGAISYHNRTDSSASQGKVSLSMSMTVQGGGGMSSRELSRREDQTNKRQDKNLMQEDSIWKKTIILGEKCRVPDEDDTILYDEKGNRISTYHPKTPSSLALSRQTSSIDPEVIPSPRAQK
ncbi:unnamed protein product [Camellia sinensis]